MRLKTLIVTALALGISSVGSFAFAAHIIPGSISETIVESRSGGQNFTNYSEAGVFPNGWQNSSAKSTAPGVTAGIGSRFNSNTEIGGQDVWFQVAPTLPTAGGTYDVYVTTTTASGAITATAGIEVTNGSGLPATTTAFSTAESGNIWGKVGQLIVDAGMNNPIVRFTEVAHSNRFYADAVLFAEVQVIPEPATLGLAAIALLGLCIGRRYRG